MKNIKLIRGTPGSGKSTFAKTFEGYQHFETDNYFIVNGVYKWNPSAIKIAHDWNKTQVEQAMTTGVDIVVSNTFIKQFEIQPYLDLSKQYNYTVEIFRLSTQFKSIHGVPQEKIDQMKYNMVNILGEIII